MTMTSSLRRRLTLRPRAGLAATALLIAGLAGSGAVALLGDFVEPARAQSTASRIDQPTPATVPDASAPGGGHLSSPHALKPDTDVMETGSTGAMRADPKADLPASSHAAR